jgi:adenosylhomocysteine nucleosidase
VSRILVVTAVAVEARGLARHLGLGSVVSGRMRRYSGPGVDLVCGGPRARRLSELAPLAHGAALVVSAGTCGALAPHLDEGDLVVPEVVLSPVGRRHLVPTNGRLAATGTLLTVDDVVETPEVKARLWRQTAALAVDMESSIIIEWAATVGIPAAVVRGVVDTAVRGIPSVFAEALDEHGRVRMGSATRMLLGRPRVLAEALTLRRGTAAAVRSVAAALRILSPPG